MLTNSRFRGFAALSLLIAAAGCLNFAGCQAADEGTEPSEPNSGADIQAALDALPRAEVVGVDDVGLPSFVAGQLGRLVIDADVESPATQKAMSDALNSLSPVLRIQPENLSFRSVHTDNEGDQHFRFDQSKNGLPVIGGEILIHVRDGQIIAFNGEIRGDLPAPSEPSITHEGALKVARDLAATITDGDATGDGELAYVREGERLRLVYSVRMTGTLQDGTPVVDDVLVDAVDGSIAARIPHIHTAKNREMHNLSNGTSLPGPTVRTEGGAAVADSIVNNNYDRLGTVYDCYKTLFNRDSYNNAGAKLVSSVHYSSNYVNAFWNGTQMVYGDGDGVNASNLANSLDVTAHELTHAVTEKTSNLTYSGESGGLNEAMSDIFGNTCEWFRDGQVVSANTWKVGEDVWTPGTAGDALRYMNDPKLDGASLDYWTSSAGNQDVHYSSGIANLAFYLLSQGGTHPRGKSSVVVTGIGIAKAAQIFYKANTSLMTSSTKFAGARTATEQAASQLGYTAAEIASVSAAWYAVGVGSAPGGGGGGSTTTLTNNVAVSPISGALNSQTFYKIDVPAGSTNLSITTSGGTGDLDLYVKIGSQPTTGSYTCKSEGSTNAETCTWAAPTAGTYYILLNAYAAYSGAKIVGAYTAGGGGGGSCAHNKCATGTKLTTGCDTCVTQICATDSYCCSTAWDSQCVSEVASICGQSCQ